MASTVELSNDFEVSEVLAEIENSDIVDLCGSGDLLEEIGIDIAIQHFTTSTLLDEIGQQEATDHFGLVAPE